MKKIIALVLAGMLLFSLTACTQKASEQSILYGKYLCYRASIGGEDIAVDDEWILLQPGGKGRLGISLETDMEWELDGNHLTIRALGGPYQATLKNDEIVLDWGGTMLFFAPLGKIEPSGTATEESQLIPYTEPTETDAPTETEPDYSAAYVTDTVTKSFIFEEMEMEYHVPEIVFDGEGIDYLNEMMYEQLFEDVYVKNVEEALNEYGMPGVAFMVYQWGRSDNFLSIAVTVTPYASEGAEFSIYNVDLSTGELASQAELLSHFGYTVESFSDRARAVMGSVVLDQYASIMDDPSLQEVFDDLMLRSTSEEYVNDARPFVGADGKLWMVAPIASIAGADRYLQVIPFEDYQISDAFLDGA